MIARFGLPGLVALLVVVCFRPVLNNDFVNWDDPYYFTGNPSYRGLSPSHLRWMFTTLYMGHYQPLSWLTHGLVYTVWGVDPFGYHLVNLLLHAASGVACYFLIAALLRRSSGRVPRNDVPVCVAAAAGALFFAIHPLRVEAVAWATERQEVLSALWLLLALLTYFRMQAELEDRQGGNWRLWYVLSLGCFALSLLSKATGMMLPIVLLALDIYPLRRFAAQIGQSIPVLIEKVPYAALALTAAAVALYAKNRAGMADMATHGVVERMMQGAYGLTFYLWKTIAPFRLSPLYLLKRPLDPTEPKYILSALAVMAVTVSVLYLRRRFPWALIAWTCYVAMLWPLLGLFQTGPQLVADRYTYISCLPWATLVAAGIYRLWLVWEERPPRRSLMFATAVTVVLALCALGAGTYEQTLVWRNSFTLWTHALEVDPTNYMAYNSRGDARLVAAKSPSACRVEGDLAGAVFDYSQAVRFAPPGAPHRATFDGNLKVARQQLAACGTQDSTPH